MPSYATRKPVGDGAICPLRNSKFAEFIVEVFGRMPPHAANVRVPHIQVLSLKLVQIRRNPQPLATCDSRKQLTLAREAALPRSVPQTLAGQPPHLCSSLWLVILRRKASAELYQ